jgi:hypothetical protein
MSEKSPVSKRDSIMPSLKSLVYSWPALKGINCKRDSSGALFSPIKLILLIGFEKDCEVKKKKRRVNRSLKIFFIFSPIVVNFFNLKKPLIQLTEEV